MLQEIRIKKVVDTQGSVSVCQYKKMYKMLTHNEVYQFVNTQGIFPIVDTQGSVSLYRDKKIDNPVADTQGSVSYCR